MFRYKILLGVFTAFALFSLFVKSVFAQTPTLEFVKQVMVEGAIDVDIQADRAYVAAGAGGVSTIDISDPTNASEVGSPYDPEGRVFYSVDASGEYAYATSVEYSTNRFYILKINLTTGLTEEFTSQNYPGAGWEILKVDNYVYIASGGLPIFDASAPGDPIFPQGFENTAYLDLKVRGNTLYAVQETSFDIIDITNRTAPVLVDRFVVTGIGSARGMDVDENYAYLAVGHPGIAVVNLSDATFVKWLDTFEYPWDVEVENGYAFVAQGIHGISAVDLQTDTEVAIYDTPGSADRLTVSGNYVYVADGVGGLAILRFTGLSIEPPCSLPNFGDIDGNPLRQEDARWGGSLYGGKYFTKSDGVKVFLPFIFYGNNKDTIGTWGCKLVSVTMIVNYFAKEQSVIDPTTDQIFQTDPKELNEWLQKNGGYNSGVLLPDRKNPQYWSAAGVDLASVSKFAKDKGVQFSWDGALVPKKDKDNSPLESVESFISRTRQSINNSMCALNPVILGVNDTGHFIDATGNALEENTPTWRIYDPLWNGIFPGVTTLKTAYGNEYTKIDLTSGGHPKRHLTITKYSPIQLYVTDPGGRKVGIDATTNSFFEEIPSSSYGEEYLGADDGGGGIIHFGMLDIVDPASGEFTLYVTGTGNGRYGLEIRGSDEEVNVTSIVVSGETFLGQTDIYRIIYSSDENQKLKLIREIIIDVKPHDTNNVINLKNKGVIPVAILTTVSFDATKIDPLSVKFGPGEAREIHRRGHLEDVNNDGLQDLMLHFAAQQTGIGKNQTEVCIIGRTKDGQNIVGCDLVKVVKYIHKTIKKDRLETLQD